MSTPSDRIRARLIHVVTKLAREVRGGGVRMTPDELEALARVLDEHRLSVEARRVRRWLSTAERGTV
ncbi:MAG TPA: hypothetical protein VJN96_09110 [Vicinamibacterales bacterium]|nr:hypothetical protein [Vicinamibacterales bacterium]